MSLLLDSYMDGFKVLLADDDLDDRMLFEEAFSEIGSGSSLVTLNDGQELLSYLLVNQTNLPDVIFLDLNMPVINGYRCLDEIRCNVGLNNIFIVINTTTASPREIDLVYEKKADLFLRKPDSFEELKKSIKSILSLDFESIKKNRHRDRFVFRPEMLGNKVR